MNQVFHATKVLELPGEIMLEDGSVKLTLPKSTPDGWIYSVSYFRVRLLDTEINCVWSDNNHYN